MSFFDIMLGIKTKGFKMSMVYCRECGAKHSDRATVCPKCGYQAGSADKSMLVYILLAFFLGMWGAHKFYAGRNGEGVAMLLMGTIGWLLIIPGIVVTIWAFVDLIIGIINVNDPKKILK